MVVIVLPKRALSLPDDIAALRALLRNHAAKARRLRDPARDPTEISRIMVAPAPQ
jgi:hypothetical protein